MSAIRSTPSRPVAGHSDAGRAIPRRRPASKAAIAGRTLRYVGLIVLAAIYISPLVFMFLTSFKTGPDATSVPPTWIPDPWTTQAYETVFSATNTPVLRWFLNSMIAATLHAALVVVTAALAAYPLARMNFRGRGLILALVIGTLLVPPVILIVPSFLVVNELGWLNTLVAVIVPT
ncbi:MAG: carbohydrate ABC transporter permease, partial [Microcella sp.]